MMATSPVTAVASTRDALVDLVWNPTGGFSVVLVTVLVVATLTIIRGRPPRVLRLLWVGGLAAIVIGLAHVLIGSQVPEDVGLWVDREALPSVLASLGSSLLAFAGLAWSLQKDQERQRDQARKDERDRQFRRLEASVSEVARAIDHCDQLAGRGWRLIDGGLRPLAEPLLKRRPDGSESLWFEILERNRRLGSSSATEVPATPGEVWSTLRDARTWDDRLVERIESLATERGRRFRRSGEAWLEEYERLRSELAGLDDSLPLDLMPFVDDLELIRDILRPSDHEDALDGEGPALLLAFALTLSGLRAMSDAEKAAEAARKAGGPAERRAAEPSTKGVPEEMLKELWRPGKKQPTMPAVDLLGLVPERDPLDTDRRSTVKAMLADPAEDGGRSFSRAQHWTDVVRPSTGPGAPDARTREAALTRDFPEDGSGVLFHIVLLLLAPVRRERLRRRGEDWVVAARPAGDGEAEGGRSPRDLPADGRALWAQIIEDMTGKDGTDDKPRDEPRRTASGGSLRPRFSELEPPLSDPSEGNPADLWRLYDNRRTWEGLSDDEDASDALSAEDDHGPSGWTAPD